MLGYIIWQMTRRCLHCQHYIGLLQEKSIIPCWCIYQYCFFFTRQCYKKKTFKECCCHVVVPSNNLLFNKRSISPQEITQMIANKMQSGCNFINKLLEDQFQVFKYSSYCMKFAKYKLFFFCVHVIFEFPQIDINLKPLQLN